MLPPRDLRSDWAVRRQTAEAEPALSAAALYLQSFERSIDRRHVYTKQTASNTYHTAEASMPLFEVVLK